MRKKGPGAAGRTKLVVWRLLGRDPGGGVCVRPALWLPAGGEPSEVQVSSNEDLSWPGSCWIPDGPKSQNPSQPSFPEPIAQDTPYMLEAQGLSGL